MAGQRTKPRLKRLRVLFVLLGLGVIALVSTVFGMMMAVSQDLPAIYNFAEYRASKNSEVFDVSGQPIGTLTSNDNKILLTSGQISRNMKNAVVAVEDARYYKHDGVDFKGIARALSQDVLSLSARQGASTITQQFVKDALAAQSNRTVLQKFREAALAYRLEQRWSKDKILTEYLNTIYFGQGAYGIEAAARTYFGAAHPGCGTEDEPCASVLEPWEAATLAGIISSPSMYDPKFFPENALARRNFVLGRMQEQDYITEEQHRQSVRQALPAPASIKPPTLDSKAPYYTAWLRQQLVDRFGAARTFFGGLKIKSTLDLDLQNAAQEVVDSYLGGVTPTAAVVVIDNRNAGIRAMVAGPDFDSKPFNLATLGHRQPGSSIKPMILATALQQGISPESVYTSAPREFTFGKREKEVFKVANYEDSYLGAASLATATTYSDNAIYAEVGLEAIKGNTRAIARTARKLGVRTKLSTNPAMVLGGLREGVTPLEWTYAYSTLANDGDRVSGTLAPVPGDTPVAYTKVTDQNDNVIKGGDNDSIHTQVMPSEVAAETKRILHSVVTAGTGARADIGDSSQWGKTGTTENNGDAWYCGAIEEVTACVWVGYADTTTPMLTEYAGAPVDGGTFPALIWSSVVSAWRKITKERAAERKREKAIKKAEGGGGEEESSEESETTDGTDYTAPPIEETTPAPSSGRSRGGTENSESGRPERGGESEAAREGPAEGPAEAPTEAAPTPATPTAPPAGEGGGGSSGGGVAAG